MVECDLKGFGKYSSGWLLTNCLETGELEGSIVLAIKILKEL